MAFDRARSAGSGTGPVELLRHLRALDNSVPNRRAEMAATIAALESIAAAALEDQRA
jgi:hypothetical protein